MTARQDRDDVLATIQRMRTNIDELKSGKQAMGGSVMRYYQASCQYSVTVLSFYQNDLTVYFTSDQPRSPFADLTYQVYLSAPPATELLCDDPLYPSISNECILVADDAHPNVVQWRVHIANNTPSNQIWYVSFNVQATSAGTVTHS